MKIRNTISWIVLIVLLVGGFFAVSNIQNIRDWVALRNYQPPEKIVALADKTTMKPETRRIFYVNHPQLDDKTDFRNNCQIAEQSIVLGCFVNNKGIFLLNVSDKRLSGIIEVTAAHETLHAIYDRLTSDEKAKVDKMTSDFFATIKDERILTTIENYRKKDPSVVPNELHSILASEVKDLSPELEEYYAKYFNDRQQIVSFSSQYEQAFLDLENKVEDYDQQLKSIKNQIDTNQANLVQQNLRIEDKRRELDSLLSGENFDQYNSQVGPYNQIVASYNSLINSTKQLVEKYNNLLEERNSIALQEQELVNAIDTNSIPKEKTK